MQHTVIAFFDTHAEAEAARAALIGAGLAAERIAMQARCEPTYATDATTVAERPAAEEGLLASIERFFESLFASAQPSHETAQYAEAVRRGAVMLSVDATDDAQCELARATLERTGPIDIEERAATWHAPSDEALRERSPLEELGLRRGRDARQRGAVRSYPRDEGSEVKTGAAQAGAQPISEAQANAMAAGCAPGMGAVFAAKRGAAAGTTDQEMDAAAAAPSPSPSPSATVPDEYLQGEEDFSGKKESGG
ncbi:hypothetical protein WKR88_17530 [Trinickia caryophylli]|uniref:Uncharacterized protein n=1 Tax=Trinickia caryophylli TaxID=28094 RepID=A0A1X7G4I1_TRICW|nr:hypothetical protein [Trinickia caryophylli]PMS13779.1 hypothetical protein C0Z17_02590 [Trinickia caryophylli]TRX14278.1 hypothetical protein FNF07_23575 [Trinickia caryophylli]WQE14109.1 hypothetical protein U0034_25770 [Trinickia caryophylli]SMF63813.1 hypothetical protein SAMN06295900_113133 [Trinickia caryophylli]GLU33397.1 hypothetical protein Busp01_32390 [Trinickia caryophylli]